MTAALAGQPIADLPGAPPAQAAAPPGP
jgi:hypothetical protein